MKYRVAYPLITCEAERVFDNECEALAFARKRRELIIDSPYMLNRMADRVTVEPVTGEPTGRVGLTNYPLPS
jgi:hypothetical protein